MKKGIWFHLTNPIKSRVVKETAQQWPIGLIKSTYCNRLSACLLFSRLSPPVRSRTRNDQDPAFLDVTIRFFLFFFLWMRPEFGWRMEDVVGILDVS